MNCRRSPSLQEHYLPFGRSALRTSERNRYRFIGVERDVDTGLCMTGPRTYDPLLGRFLQPDPLVQPGEGPFVYASGNPVVRLDPGGYDPVDADLSGGVDPDLDADEPHDLLLIISGGTQKPVMAWDVRTKEGMTGPADAALDLGNKVREGVRAMGRSPPQIENYWPARNPEQNVELLSGLLDRQHQDGERLAIYGYSYGGGTALDLQNSNSGHDVGALVLVDATYGLLEPVYGLNRTVAPSTAATVNIFQENMAATGADGGHVGPSSMVSNLQVFGSTDHSRVEPQTRNLVVRELVEFFAQDAGAYSPGSATTRLERHIVERP